MSDDRSSDSQKIMGGLPGRSVATPNALPGKSANTSNVASKISQKFAEIFNTVDASTKRDSESPRKTGILIRRAGLSDGEMMKLPRAIETVSRGDSVFAKDGNLFINCSDAVIRFVINPN